MAIFDDMTTELAAYPVTNVTLEVVEVAFPGNALNSGEEGTFRVKVSNKGPLNLTGVTLRSGQNGATVAGNGSAATFVPEFTTSVIPTIGGHVGSQFLPDDPSNPLKFKAPKGKQPSKTLIKATIEKWDANLDHILIDHSDPLPNGPAGTYVAEVVAS